MKRSNIIMAIAALSIFAACSKKIDLDLPDYNSKLVINGEFDTDKDIAVTVSRSLPIMKVTDSTGYLIMNATVKVFENGVNIGNATYFSGQYVLPKKPVAGRKYSVEVSSGTYPTAVANLEMPKSLTTVSSYKDSVGLDADGFKVGQITLTFNDDINVKNYYKLLIRWYNASTLQWYPLNIVSNDIIFLNNDKLSDGSYAFSDRTFNGKTKTLTFQTTSSMGTGTPKFEISVKTFNDEYYQYLLQTDDYSQSGNAIGVEPVIIRTNVKNGLGMVGGISNAKDTIF